jgi:uncharacterized protein YdeI (YjbR/CyaY-like superfamily)
VFLKDPEGVLINAQEVTKSLRQWRFASAEEIRQHQTTIRAYLEEAIRNQEAGKAIKPERNKAFDIPSELHQALKSHPSLKESFEGLSPGKRKEYALHVGGAKREETRQQRLQKVIPMILEGIGLNDKYSRS